MTVVEPTLPDEAITLAAEAMEDAAVRWLGRDLGTIHRDDIASEALAAAYPVLRAHIETKLRSKIADEIETDGRTDVQWLAEYAVDRIDRARLIGVEDAYKAAARVARGEQP